MDSEARDITAVIVTLVRCLSWLRAIDAYPDRYDPAAHHLPAITPVMQDLDARIVAWIEGSDRRRGERRRKERRGPSDGAAA